jgi:torsin-1
MQTATFSLCSFVILHLVSFVLSIEPISTGIFFGLSAIGGFKYFDDIKLHTYCKYEECCMKELIPFDIMKLQASLQDRLFGQHIVQEKLFQAVASHYKEIDKSQKPLVMSFHGTQGTGKNFVSNFIAEAVFERGTRSKFYHIFHGSQYLDVDKVSEYKEQIKQDIFAAIEKCPYSIFVFDEVDKMPEGIFDSITSILDHHTLVRGKDFRKAIFIFLTNYGGEEITKVLYLLTHSKGLFRHDTKLHHFEDINKIGVYNREGGLKESRLITSAVIDFYLPFLPLEVQHVTECIKAEYKSFGRPTVTSEMVEEILKYIGFHSVTKFANTGCKTIHPKVRAECL